MNVTDEYLDAVNAVVPNCSPIAAYCVGVVSVIISERTGVCPTKVMVQAAAMCRTIPDAVELAEMFVKELKPRSRKRPQKLPQISVL